MTLPNPHPHLLHAEATDGRVGDLTTNRAVIHETALVHPDALVGNTAEWIGHHTTRFVHVGAHSIIRAFVTVDAGVKRNTVIGSDVLLMAHVHVGHDVVIGDRCQLAPHASIGGCVTIGQDVKIGMGATIRPHATVGDGARIGMGAVVTKDIPAGETWVGNPARKLAA